MMGSPERSGCLGMNDNYRSMENANNDALSDSAKVTW